MEKSVKIILAVLFFLCLLDMPYGFYQLVRFLGFLGFLLLAYYSYERNEIPIAIIFLGLALLFQPFLKVALGRTLWNVVDVVTGIFLLLTLLKTGGKKSEI